MFSAESFSATAFAFCAQVHAANSKSTKELILLWFNGSVTVKLVPFLYLHHLVAGIQFWNTLVVSLWDVRKYSFFVVAVYRFEGMGRERNLRWRCVCRCGSVRTGPTWRFAVEIRGDQSGSAPERCAIRPGVLHRSAAKKISFDKFDIFTGSMFIFHKGLIFCRK